MTVVDDPARLSDDLRQAVLELAAAAEARDGAPPLSDQARVQLRSDAVVHVVVRDAEAVTGYAQRNGAAIEVVAADEPSLEAALRRAGERGGAPAEVWAHGDRSPVAPVAARLGYRAERTLLQLRRPLDATVTPAALAAGVDVRPFQPGRDEPGWLALNAAAFAHHPEQARMTRADLDARMAEPWFDPDGFLLAERDGKLVGFHWTKRHPGAVGEVYVLGVAPDAQGLGLGAALLTRGLAWLAGHGCTTAMLYVDADNPGAVRLYERNNFHRFSADVQWRAARFT